LPEVALLYGMVSISFALAEGIGRGFDLFPGLVKSGDFDRLLLRPVSTALQVAGQELQFMRLGGLALGAMVLGFALNNLHLHWTVWKELLLLAAILGGACLFYGLFVLQATLSFWTIETLELMNTLTYGGVETAQYPLSIYRPWFREFFTWVVPLAAVTFFPAHAILGRTGAGAPLPLVQWLSPLVGVLFLVVSLRVWKIGEYHYRSTGS
nr:ABC-2 family transporter protein [Armatimonadota bacterium]